MKYAFLCSFLFSLFLFPSCETFKPHSNESTEVLLDLSFENYIRSAAHDDTLLSEIIKSNVAKGKSKEQLIEGIIQSYTEKKSLQVLLETFSRNQSLPKFRNTVALKQFLIADFNAKIKKFCGVVRNRIYSFTGIQKDKITINKTQDRLRIIVPGIEDESIVKAAFTNTDGISFWEVVTLKDIGADFAKLNDSLKKMKYTQKAAPLDTSKELSLMETIEQNEDNAPHEDDLFSLLHPAIGANGEPYNASFLGIASIKDTAAINLFFSKPLYSVVFPENIKILWGLLPGRQSEAGKVVAAYAIKMGPGREPMVNGDDIKSAAFYYQEGRAEISIAMNNEGKLKWATATEKCVGKPIAIELAGFVYSAPFVTERITEGYSSITGDFTAEEGDYLTKVINSGRFPLPFKIASIGKYKK